jgi:hypothetical protein
VKDDAPVKIECTCTANKGQLMMSSSLNNARLVRLKKPASCWRHCILVLPLLLHLHLKTSGEASVYCSVAREYRLLQTLCILCILHAIILDIMGPPFFIQTAYFFSYLGMAAAQQHVVGAALLLANRRDRLLRAFPPNCNHFTVYLLER